MNKKKPPTITEMKVEQIIDDDKNFNIGSEEGKAMLKKSLKKFGTGRSILLDKNNKTIGGNKTVKTFREQGGKNVVVVEADRNTLIAVKRTDIDLDSKEGREMALADNQTQAINYIPDEEIIQAVAEELNIDTGEWGLPMDEETYNKKLKTEELRPFVKTHVLLSFPPELIMELEPYLEAIKKISGVEYEQSSN